MTSTILWTIILISTIGGILFLLCLIYSIMWIRAKRYEKKLLEDKEKTNKKNE